MTITTRATLGELLRERYRVAIEQFEAQVAEATEFRGGGMEQGDAADLGAQVADAEQLDMVTSSLRQQVLRMQAALDRFEHGQYGVCDRCDDRIPRARLEIMPWATQCVPCQQRADRHAG